MSVLGYNRMMLSRALNLRHATHLEAEIVQIDILSFQVRSQEEIMNECQVWWTITGNFGNMMPIDW